MSPKEILFDLFGIAFGLFFLAHLILIFIYGAVAVYEDNSWILWAEVAAVAGIVGLGIERLISDIRWKD